MFFSLFTIWSNKKCYQYSFKGDGKPLELQGFMLLQGLEESLEAGKPNKLPGFGLLQGLGESLEAVSRI